MLFKVIGKFFQIFFPYHFERNKINNVNFSFIKKRLNEYQFFFFSISNISAYRTPDARPWVLPVVKKTEIIIAECESINHEYLPVTGIESFTKASVTLLLGEDSPAIKENRAHGVQSLSGTGALRLGAEFLSNKLGRKVVYYSDPTWGEFNCVKYY